MTSHEDDEAARQQQDEEEDIGPPASTDQAIPPIEAPIDVVALEELRARLKRKY